MCHEISIKPILVLDQAENRSDQDERADNIQSHQNSHPAALPPALAACHLALVRGLGCREFHDAVMEYRCDDHKEAKEQELYN